MPIIKNIYNEVLKELSLLIETPDSDAEEEIQPDVEIELTSETDSEGIPNYTWRYKEEYLKQFLEATVEQELGGLGFDDFIDKSKGSHQFGVNNIGACGPTQIMWFNFPAWSKVEGSEFSFETDIFNNFSDSEKIFWNIFGAKQGDEKTLKALADKLKAGVKISDNGIKQNTDFKKLFELNPAKYGEDYKTKLTKISDAINPKTVKPINDIFDDNFDITEYVYVKTHNSNNKYIPTDNLRSTGHMLGYLIVKTAKKHIKEKFVTSLEAISNTKIAEYFEDYKDWARVAAVWYAGRKYGPKTVSLPTTPPESSPEAPSIRKYAGSVIEKVNKQIPEGESKLIDSMPTIKIKEEYLEESFTIDSPEDLNIDDIIEISYPEGSEFKRGIGNDRIEAYAEKLKLSEKINAELEKYRENLKGSINTDDTITEINKKINDYQDKSTLEQLGIEGVGIAKPRFGPKEQAQLKYYESDRKASSNILIQRDGSVDDKKSNIIAMARNPFNLFKTSRLKPDMENHKGFYDEDGITLEEMINTQSISILVLGAGYETSTNKDDQRDDDGRTDKRVNYNYYKDPSYKPIVGKAKKGWIRGPIINISGNHNQVFEKFKENFEKEFDFGPFDGRISYQLITLQTKEMSKFLKMLAEVDPNQPQAFITKYGIKKEDYDKFYEHHKEDWAYTKKTLGRLSLSYKLLNVKLNRFFKEKSAELKSWRKDRGIEEKKETPVNVPKKLENSFFIKLYKKDIANDKEVEEFKAELKKRKITGEEFKKAVRVKINQILDREFKEKESIRYKRYYLAIVKDNTSFIVDPESIKEKGLKRKYSTYYDDNTIKMYYKKVSKENKQRSKKDAKKIKEIQKQIQSNKLKIENIDYKKSLKEETITINFNQTFIRGEVKKLSIDDFKFDKKLNKWRFKEFKIDDDKKTDERQKDRYVEIPNVDFSKNGQLIEIKVRLSKSAYNDKRYKYPNLTNSNYFIQNDIDSLKKAKKIPKKDDETKDEYEEKQEKLNKKIAVYEDRITYYQGLEYGYMKYKLTSKDYAKIELIDDGNKIIIKATGDIPKTETQKEETLEKEMRTIFGRGPLNDVVVATLTSETAAEYFSDQGDSYLVSDDLYDRLMRDLNAAIQEKFPNLEKDYIYESKRPTPRNIRGFLELLCDIDKRKEYSHASDPDMYKLYFDQIVEDYTSIINAENTTKKSKDKKEAEEAEEAEIKRAQDADDKEKADAKKAAKEKEYKSMGEPLIIGDTHVTYKGGFGTQINNIFFGNNAILKKTTAYRNATPSNLLDNLGSLELEKRPRVIVIVLGENGVNNLKRLLVKIHDKTPKSKIIFFSLPSVAKNADQNAENFDKEKFIKLLDRYEDYRTSKEYSTGKPKDPKKYYKERIESGTILNGWEYEMSRYGSPVFPSETGEPESIADAIELIKSNKSNNFNTTKNEIVKFKKQLEKNGYKPEKIIKYVNIYDEEWELTKLNDIPFSDGIHLTADASKTILSKFKADIDAFIKAEKIDENKMVLNDKLLRMLIRKIIS